MNTMPTTQTVPDQNPSRAPFRQFFEPAYKLQEGLLPPGQFRVQDGVITKDVLKSTGLSVQEIHEFLKESLRGLDLLVQAMESVNSQFSLGREPGEMDALLIPPVVLALIESLPQVPGEFQHFKTLADKSGMSRQIVPGWDILPPFTWAIPRVGQIPEKVVLLQFSNNSEISSAAGSIIDRRAILRHHLQAEQNMVPHNENKVVRLEAELNALEEQIDALFDRDDFIVDPQKCSDIVRSLGVTVHPTLDILNAYIPLALALDEHLACAITERDTDVPKRLPIPFPRTDGTVESIGLEIAPSLLADPEIPMSTWLDALIRLRGNVAKLRELAERMTLDTQTMRDYQTALKDFSIPFFGARPDLARPSVARLLEQPEPTPEMQDAILAIICTAARVRVPGMCQEQTLIPIADFPSNIPLLSWMLRVSMQRDDLDAGVSGSALHSFEPDLLRMVAYCKNCVRDQRYADLAYYLARELDKAMMEPGTRETRKAGLILILDSLILCEEVRKTLKNLIPRVDDLRKIAASITVRDAAQLIQEAVDRVTRGLTPTLDDYFGQDAMKSRVKRMIARFLHVAEDPSRLCGRKPCEVVKNGLLLPGPPGGGKTFFMDCLVNTLGLHCFAISPDKAKPSGKGSAAPDIMKQASLVDLLEQTIVEAETYVVKHKKSCVVKLDEFEQFCLDRHQFKNHFEQTNRSLALIERLRRNPQVFLLAATNHYDFIDEAMRRVGRFDVVREIGLPDMESACRIVTGAIVPFPAISLTQEQTAEIAELAAKGGLIPLSIIQALTSDIVVTGQAPDFEDLKSAIVETVEDRRMGLDCMPHNSSWDSAGCGGGLCPPVALRANGNRHSELATTQRS